MTTITWSVEVDADPDTTGLFVIGSSLIGGPDLIAPNERWIDVGPVVRKVSIRRGGSDGVRAYNAGEATVEFDNRTGDFDPDNPYGFYVMGPQRLLTQGTGLRVKAHANATATVFSGSVEEPRNTDDLVLPTATYTCTDLMADLGKIDVPFQGSQTGTGESSSARANWLLDQASIPAAQRSVAAAGRQCLGTTGGGKVREALERVAAGEAGRFFVDRAGIVILTWHDAEYSKPTQATFNDDGSATQYALLESSPGIVGIVNSATVHRIVPQVRNEETGQFEAGPELDDVGAADWDSISLYGPTPRSVTADVVLQNDADVASLATFLATRRSQPTPRVSRLVTVPLQSMTAAQAQAVLEADLGDLITVTRHTVDGRLRLWTANIENIAIDATQMETRVTWETSPSDTAGIFGGTGWFIIGSSLIGGPDVIAPY